MKIEKIKGFRDHYPDDMEIRNYFLNKITSAAENFGYGRIDFPSLEPLDLYRLKSGTELVNQTFSFTDKGGREVTMIPEATPSTMRLLTARKDLPKPVRWYSVPKVWRYEEPQEGRFREHYQFNADMFGLDSAETDAEIVGLASTILDSIGLSGIYEININDRFLMEYILKDLGVQDVSGAFSIIDKFKKIDKKSFILSFEGIGAKDDEIKKILSLLGEKVDIDNLEKRVKKVVKNYDDIKSRIDRIKKTFDLIKLYTESQINYDFSIVRGLSYYTGMVFEAFDIKGELRAILGGGRYDDLSKLFIEEQIPAVGFAIGDAVIELLLKRQDLWMRRDKKESYYICNISSGDDDYIVKIASRIRSINKIAIIDMTHRKLASQMKTASGFDYAIIIGEKEVEENALTVKNMKISEQSTVGYDDFLLRLRNKSE
ncbi:histidine--tRNA ligase [Ferroplasma sp.]|uniref:histidine--tRNA ligase n=1 Tax=Ferroplasma sp. TaxID=2591003 RepID=UPI00307F1CA2